MAKFYLTTAIDYTNGPPHVGHALEKIQADVLARWHREKGDEVFFLTGTDEHGAKIARAAEAAGKKPQKFVDELAERFRAMGDALNLSWREQGDFIRTTDIKRHFPGAELMWRKLVEAGDIYKKKYEGLYCVGHEAFITQKDLVDGKCADHGKAPEKVEEENYFFKLSRYSEEIGRRIKSKELRILPETREREILSLIEKEGLEDVSFSRSRKDLEWGIPVPGDETQTMYVWCDALVNYISAIGYGRNEDYKRWWPADVQVIGKDILRFHAAIWPGMLLAAGLPLPKAIFVHGFITVEGQKMSKTLGNVLDPFALVKKYGTDAVRYYLLREIPTGEDGDFSEAKFRERYNADLANGLGNLVSRVMKMAVTHGVSWDDYLGTDEKFHNYPGVWDAAYSDFNLKQVLENIWEKITALDIYIQRNEPYKKIKTDEKSAKKDIAYLLSHVLRISYELEAFLPGTALEIRKFVLENKIPESPLFPRLS